MGTNAHFPKKPIPTTFGPTLQILSERLYDSINRGPLLKCFLTKSSASRIDISRLDAEAATLDPERNQLLIDYGQKLLPSSPGDFDKWSKQLSKDVGLWVRPYLGQVWEKLSPTHAMAQAPRLSSRIVDSLISSENASLSFQLDISSENDEIRASNIALYQALGQKIARTADLIKKEAGLRSLWLGYPMFIAQDLTTTEDRWYAKGNTHNESEAAVILAPLLLWPVDIHVSLSRQGQINLARDSKVGPPSFNRALQRWVKTRLHVDLAECEIETAGGALTRQQLEIFVGKITSGLSRVYVHSLTEPLERLPSRKESLALPQPAVLNTAVLGIFVSENQALIDNLDGLRNVPEISGPLEGLLSGKVEDHRPIQVPSERDRYLVASSDPFQEMAVWDARHSPGTVVHGPPGTGKSQTIVNIVADALAHGEKVLVVCQKRAAIDVVFRRINAASLGSLCTVVHDSESDRSRIILDVKEQISSIGQYSRRADAAQRAVLSAEIDKRELDLDLYYKAVQVSRPDIGLSYRTLVSRLGAFALTHPGLHPSPEIGQLLKGKSELALKSIVASLDGIGSLFDLAATKANPWCHRTSDFFLTAILVEEISEAISNCNRVAVGHENYVSANGPGIKPEQLDQFETSARAAIDILERITKYTDDLDTISQWLNTPEESKRQLDELRIQQRELSDLSLAKQRSPCEGLDTFPPDIVAELSVVCMIVIRGLEGNWLRRIRPSFRRAKQRLLTITPTISAQVTTEALLALRGECLLVLKRGAIQNTLDALRPKVETEQGRCVQPITERLSHTISELACVNEINGLSPVLRSLVADAVNYGMDAVNKAISTLRIATNRVPLLHKLQERLAVLRHWIKPSYLDGLLETACNAEPIGKCLLSLIQFLPTLPNLIAFDTARNRLDELDSNLLDCLISLGAPTSAWEPLVVISALTVWGQNCMDESPELRSMSLAAFEANKSALERALRRKRELESGTILDSWSAEQRRLKELRPSPLNALRSQLVTRGPNSKRLRQVMAVGAENGLFALRPCWLTNPNTACQIFGLTPDMFDVVIFDEASQCPVEQAVPLIYRGKRLIVSGDEKQLPPTSFFVSFGASSLAQDSDVEDESDLSDEDIAEKEMKKQILNSKDLLTVCEPLLRGSYLDMHYRSEHPSLIEFSNHAFYGGRLQFPPAHANKVSTPAIDYREVSGIYENRQNRDEAYAVIALLRQIWKEEPCPTIGVVTFNAVQQDLIENLIQAEALKDSEFRMRYEFEVAREEEQQQVGFFVKNLESVQGDERDVIIFSTTFGRDGNGAFKRFFGPVTLDGGEKRLNVAITRAKKKVYVLTSMPTFEISDAFTSIQAFEGKKVTGREYLQGYLLYAKAVSEGDDARAHDILQRARQLGFSKDGEGSQTSIDFDSEFEIAVYEALKRRGVVLDTQVGVAGFRVDLAVRHVEPARGYLMGIECDGKAFHSSFSARARDVWREQILRSRGWKIHRIWSSAWWSNPEYEIQKVLEAIQRYSA